MDSTSIYNTIVYNKKKKSDGVNLEETEEGSDTDELSDEDDIEMASSDDEDDATWPRHKEKEESWDEKDNY